MYYFSKRITAFGIISLIIFVNGCKDENVINSYLNLTRSNRIEESINLNSENILINVVVRDFKSNELMKNTKVTLKQPDGKTLTDITDNYGKAKFKIEKCIRGKFEVSTEIKNDILTECNNFEIYGTFNYNILIYVPNNKAY